MTTHLPADEELPKPVASLPVLFDGEFQLWRYGSSHSELKLRSVGPSSARDFIEMTFYGVVGMKLRSVYRPLTLASAEPAQIEEILGISEVRESQSSRVRCLALKSGGIDGLVACLSYSVWSHPRGSERDVTGIQSPDSVLILRG
ncbi:hypothetical protein [Kitasatospora sp. NPDC054795]